VLKVASDGQLQWAAPQIVDTEQDPASSVGTAMTIGADGSVALLGSYQGQVDIDPGSGVALLPSTQEKRTFFATFSPSGALSGSRTYDGSFALSAWAASGAGYAAAFSFGSTSPFGLVPGTALTTFGSNDIALVTLDANGELTWAGQIGGPSLDFAYDLVPDGAGGLLLAGDSSNSVDFDPAAARTHTVSNTDSFLLKLRPVGATKFYVVNDASVNRTYEYDAPGESAVEYSLHSGNTTPRGAASTAAGDKVWVIDGNRKVYVYNASGALLGSWTAGSLSSSADEQGIATNGTDIWIVDAKSDRVFKYAGAASRLSGSQNAASSFSLNSGNRNPSDIVTDGASIWVLNNSSTDKVFRYSVSGTLQGSWTIDGGGGSPTGLTIDPSGASASIWIVDSSSDRVYELTSAKSRISGSQAPITSFPLASGNTNPQGIADPPAASDSGAASEEPTNASLDSALLAIVGELDELRGSGKKRR
jgi:hypothetical protein